VLFNSAAFIFLFLPLVLFGYYLFKDKHKLSNWWLISASLFFYAYWKLDYLFIILASILVNYACGLGIQKYLQLQRSKAFSILTLGVLFNLGLLAYFKYADFLIFNLNYLFSGQLGYLGLLLPLAISFFTFQQVAFLIDSYRGECKELDFSSYCLFVTFFPQLIAGPIVHHKEMMPQFSDPRAKQLNLDNLTLGMYVFAIGLFKKVILADSLAQYADPVFDLASPERLDFVSAWLGSLCYTFQIYFDFSGYCDMAIGVALMFNIRIPINFKSPYKARNIQAFWRGWHITLSRWFREYVYIPLGGNRISEWVTLRNVFIVAFISGLWHGAGWTFVIWGAAHGLALVVHRIYSRGNWFKLPTWLAWMMTFLFVNFAWVFFRAESFDSAYYIVQAMLDFNDIQLPKFIEFYQGSQDLTVAPMLFESVLGVYWLILSAGIAFWGIWSMDLAKVMLASRFRSYVSGFGFASMLFVALIAFGSDYSAFIYFNF